jgi:hypothetical protein
MYIYAVYQGESKKKGLNPMVNQRELLSSEPRGAFTRLRIYATGFIRKDIRMNRTADWW